MSKNGIRTFHGHLSQRPPQQAARPLSIQTGHNGQTVIVVFTHPVQNLGLTEAETESHIKGLQDSLAALRAHKAASHG